MGHSLRIVSYLSVFALLIMLPTFKASPRFWPWEARSTPSSIVNISIGNRVNTKTELQENGTVIRDLAINLSQWNGNLTFTRNGTEISVTRGNDGITKINISFDFESAVTNATVNNTKSILSRRKRGTGILLPLVPIPMLNGSLAFLDGNLITLPNAILNLTNSTIDDIRDYLQPWQLLQTFLNRRLPMLVLDNLVSFLSQIYSFTGKRIIETSINAVGETTDYLSNIVNSTLDMATEQASSGIRNVVRNFKDLSPASQSCVGQIPDDVARQIVSTATGCVKDRWNEVEDIVNQFLDVVTRTEEAYGGWLQSLDKCTGKNFEGLSESQLDIQQRDCYVQAIASSVRKMIDIPTRWLDLNIRASNAVTSFQPLVGLCATNVVTEIASVSADIGLKIILCQFF